MCSVKDLCTTMLDVFDRKTQAEIGTSIKRIVHAQVCKVVRL